MEFCQAESGTPPGALAIPLATEVRPQSSKKQMNSGNLMDSKGKYTDTQEVMKVFFLLTSIFQMLLIYS